MVTGFYHLNRLGLNLECLDDHDSEDNIRLLLTGVVNTVYRKQCKNIITTTHTPFYSCASSWKMQGNEMTDEKKKYQMKSYYLTRPLSLTEKSQYISPPE